MKGCRENEFKAPSHHKRKSAGSVLQAVRKNTAKQLGLTGWIRNKPDGTVEIVAEGDKLALEALLEKCRHGSVWSKVDEIEKKWEKPTGEFKEVEISY